MPRLRSRSALVPLSVLVLLAGLALLPAAPAAASADDDRVRDLTISYEIDAAGTVHVTETYRWDFGSREGRGFARELDVAFEHDDDHIREYVYADFAAHSPSGAPAELVLVDEGATLEVQVAAPQDSDERVTGVQTYVLSYTISGALNAVREQQDVPDADEFFWNVQGPDHQPTDQVEVTVAGPVDATAARCTQDSGGTECSTLSDPGAVVTASATDLDDGDPLTIAVAYPPGTFADTEPILVDVGAWEDEHGALDSSANVGAIFAVVGGVLAVTAGSVTAGVVATRHRRRDLAFVGVPPGTIPPAGMDLPVAPVTQDPPVPLRLTPPDGLSVAEVGALRAKQLRSRDVTATIVDLAIRGFLRIEEVPRKQEEKPAKNWRLVRSDQAADDLLPHEALLLTSLFAKGTAVKMSALKETFADDLAKVLALVADRLLDRGLVSQRLGAEGASLPSFKQRTALGRAYYEQIRGFEEYLTTVEANRLDTSEGQEAFSRYLPYAIVFDGVDRWAGTLSDLEDDGDALTAPTWYAASYGMFSYHAFGASFDRFTDRTTAAISSTPGSSGGSGFSGGGASFSGGGGGGGGSRGL